MSYDDDIARAKAGMDQMSGLWRDTYVPAVVDIERKALNQGASRELAVEIAYEYLDVLIGLTGMRK